MARSESWQPVRILGKGPWSLLPAQTWSVLTDFFIFAAGLSVFYAIVVLARTWFGPVQSARRDFALDPSHLPLYAAYSLLRITIAYILSLAFTLVYGYVAAYNPRAERIMIPLLDILQSIPVLSFLPGVMLAMVALFPASPDRRGDGRHPAHLHRAGVEHGVQLLRVAEEHSARDARGGQDLPLQLVSALHPVGAAVCGDRAGMELDDVGGRRLVLPDGVRDVRAGHARFPPAGTGLVSADRGQRGRYARRSCGASAP